MSFRFSLLFQKFVVKFRASEVAQDSREAADYSPGQQPWDERPSPSPSAPPFPRGREKGNGEREDAFRPALAPCANLCRSFGAELFHRSLGQRSSGFGLRWRVMAAAVVLAVSAPLLARAPAATAMSPLRVCSDANNLPFSNMRKQGFENALARMLAQDLHRQIEYLWLLEPFLAQKLLKSGICDISTGTPGPSQLMIPTVPYYRSTFVFVSRRDRHIGISSLNDGRLARYRIGTEIIGDADSAAPPAEELVRRGLARNIVGFSVYSHPLADNPSSTLVAAVEKGKVDLAVAWGPTAGYFAMSSPVPLDITPICSSSAVFPVAFSISMGVRRSDGLLLEQVNEAIARHSEQISALLKSYGVPLVDGSVREQDCR
jgi:mxaJ protein